MVVRRRVSRDCLVSFEGRRYSVPYWLMGKEVEVRGAGRWVIVVWRGEEVKRHPRHTAAPLVLDRADYEGPSRDERVVPSTPLGRDVEAMVLERSWESPLAAPARSVEEYAARAAQLGGAR